MIARWWTGFAPVEVAIACVGEMHILRWSAGELGALNHDDIEAERTLAALGAQRFACLDALDFWRRHREDLRVLTLASRGPFDPLSLGAGRVPRMGPNTQQLVRRSAAATVAGATLTPPTPQAAIARSGYVPVPRTPRTGAQAQWTMTAGQKTAAFNVAGRAASIFDDDLNALSSLTPRLIDRLAASVAASWADRVRVGDIAAEVAEPALDAALFGRVVATLRLWLGAECPAVDVTMIPSEDDPQLVRSEGRVEARLPFDWIVKVWARGLGVVMGQFCLSAALLDKRTLALEVIGADFSTRSTMQLSLPSELPAPRPQHPRPL